ncbi:MAG: aminoacyl-tRNA hydrolase [Synergistetes bacterium]|nr:aminoacyl-tRNA hydrolase [Synergistota bacterium]
MRLVVGLGNPGPKYEFTRHNFGFRVIDFLAGRWDLKVDRYECKALTGRKDNGVLLVKPMTYMNRSGEALKELISKYKVSPHDVLVIYDDLYLPFGVIRIRKLGGAGGHKGMESIISTLGTEEIPRLRLGIGPPPPSGYEYYVLSEFTDKEMKLLPFILRRATDAIELILAEGIDKAMSLYNSKEIFEENE